LTTFQKETSETATSVTKKWIEMAGGSTGRGTTTKPRAVWRDTVAEGTNRRIIRRATFTGEILCIPPFPSFSLLFLPLHSLFPSSPLSLSPPLIPFFIFSPLPTNQPIPLPLHHPPPPPVTPGQRRTGGYSGLIFFIVDTPQPGGGRGGSGGRAGGAGAKQ